MVEISTSDLVKFELALHSKNISNDTIKRYLSCIKQNKKDSNNCIKAWKNFYKLILNQEPPEDLKTKKTKADLKVPTLDEIRITLEKAKQNSKLYILYRLLLESGIRESEALKILNSYDPSKDKYESAFTHMRLNWIRDKKGVSTRFILLHYNN
ncbi:MAG: integrase [Sulfolobaceae archaeon]